MALDVLTKGCICGCQRPATGPRGLNLQCYNVLNREVREGILTWHEAEQQGRCWPIANKRPWAKWNFKQPCGPADRVKERRQ